jgi:D-alanyl-D-alanine carboxypeptidase
LVAVGVAACGDDDCSQSGGTPSRAELQRAMDELTAAGMPGIAVRIDGPAGVEFLASGVADIAQQTRPQQSFHYRIASVSKAFNGAAVLSLARDGALRLDQTVGDLLPDLLPQAAEVTVRQLLNHTSGVFSYSDDAQFRAAFGDDTLRKFTELELVSYILPHALLFPPGTAYHYSNSDNLLLGLIAEAVSDDMSYAQVLEARLFVPLGLRGTSYPSEPKLPPPFVHGYLEDALRFPPPFARGSIRDDATLRDVSEIADPSPFGPAGAVISTLDDLAHFFSAVLRGDVYGRDLLLEAMKTVPGDSDYPGPGINHAGLAIFRYQLPCGDVWGHTGNMGGYRLYAAASPDGSRTVVAWANENPSPLGFQEMTLAVQEKATCRALSR